MLKAFSRRAAGACTRAARFTGAAASGCGTLGNAVLTGLLPVLFAVPPAQAVTDPTLSVTIQRTTPSVLLSWPATIAVPYQVESSSNLTSWAAASPVLSGTGATLTFTAAISSTAPRSFFRVERMFPAAAGTAVFNGRTGLLTVVGDNLDNTITVSRDAAGTILVNNGAMPVTGGVATVSNTVLIQVLGLAGNDRLTVDTALGLMPVCHLFGDAGDDTLTGGSGADLLVGGQGGTPSSDEVAMIRSMAATTTMSWFGIPGDGSDTIEGQAGSDTLLFNGANVNEKIDLSANGGRLRFFRDVGNVVMDVNAVEAVQFNALGGADRVVVNDLTGTAVGVVRIELAGTIGGTAGDGQGDVVTVNGTPLADTISVAAVAGAIEVSGLPALIRLTHTEPVFDALIVNGLGGIDVLSAGAGVSALIGVTLNQ